MKFEDKVAKLRIQKHKGKETEVFLHDVIHMAEGESLEYLLGEVLFCDAVIDLQLRPMIPRPETEHWVKQAIQQIQQEKKVEAIRILDMFSGSGCVGVSLLKHIPQAHVDFIEIEEQVTEQITKTLQKNRIETERTHIYRGDTYEGATGVYDYIFAVPPYVPLHMRDEVMQELQSERDIFFFDKEDGFFYIKKILEGVTTFLKAGGTLYMEFDITQKEHLVILLREYGYNTYSFLTDPYGHDCALVLRYL